MSNERWTTIARRAIEGLNVQPGELVLVRDAAGRQDVLIEMVLAVEAAGATPLVEVLSRNYIQRLLTDVAPTYLETWDRHRLAWMQQVDRVLVLGGLPPDLSSISPEACEMWLAARNRLLAVEEQRQLPFLLLAVPTEAGAHTYGCSFKALEAALLPALATSAMELRDAIERVLRAVRGGQTLTIPTGVGCELRMSLTERPWLDDDGLIDDADRARGAIVSNLPSGSVYTTVLEEATEGTLYVPNASGAIDAVLRFASGRVVEITAASGADTLIAMFDTHSGEPRRISHIGVGLNPHLHAPIGWTLVDEHVGGCLFIALGENRYMGGANESSLNVDYTIPRATLLVDERTIVENGRVVL